MGNVPAIPESTRSSITLRILLHAKEHWPKLENLQVTCRNGFAYAAAALPGGEPQPLFRLRYGGSAHSFGFALYSTPPDATKIPSCSPAALSAPRRKRSTPPAPCTSPTPATNPAPDPRRTYGGNH